MNLSTPMLGALACGLLTSCLKDGVDAPSAKQEPYAQVRFDLHCNGRPFSADSSYTDGFGTLVRFDRFRFALVGPDLLDDAGALLGEGPNVVLLADLTDPTRTFTIPVSASGEAHWVDTRTVAQTDRSTAALAPLWVGNPNDAFLCMLDIGGVYDSNDDGRLDTTDLPFRIALAPNTDDPTLRIHAHGILQADAPGIVEIPVNLSALLVDVDLPDEPVTWGQGGYATQVLHNLRTRVLGADNKPL